MSNEQPAPFFPPSSSMPTEAELIEIIGDEFIAFYESNELTSRDRARRVLDILRSCFRPPERESCWQSIETAPKDGEPVLTIDEHIGCPLVVFFNRQEWECVGPTSSGLGIGFFPTHWQPLPAPPTKGAQDK